jgi:hypothetical protein
MNIIEFLMDTPEMRKSAKHIHKHALFAGGGMAVGQMLLGPLGGMIAEFLEIWSDSSRRNRVVLCRKLNEGTRKDRIVQEVGKVLMTAGATAKQFETADAFRAALVQLASQRNGCDQVWKVCQEVVESEDSIL